MVIKKENLKQTVIILTIDEKQIKKDFEEIINTAKQKKKEPFYSVYILLPKSIKTEYLVSLSKELDIKRQSSDKNFLMLEL